MRIAGVHERQAPLGPDEDEVRERGQQAEHLDRVVVGELDRAELLAAALARVEGRDARRSSASRGPVSSRRLPVKFAIARWTMSGSLPAFHAMHRLDRELRERLDEGEDREREALGDQELRGLGRPRDDEGRADHCRERPGGGRRGEAARRDPDGGQDESR